jgi:hypothetical protein
MLKVVICKIFEVVTKSTLNLFMRIHDMSHQLMDESGSILVTI